MLTARLNLVRTSKRLLLSSSSGRSSTVKSSSLRCKASVSEAATSAATKDAAAMSRSSSSVPIATSLAAAAAGVATVSIAATVTEMATAATVPPYDPSGQRFDQSNFVGRFSRMLLQCDPRLLMYSEAQVLQAKDMLEHYQEYPGKDRALWEARRLVDSALNDQGDFVPSPFRMSGYVGFNGPICVAMVASQSTTPLLFWAWVNQSQNALVNYYNRNSSSTMTNETLFQSYAAAVGSALVVAFGLATAIQKRYPPAQAKALLRWVAFPSAVVASSLNCYIVRAPEIQTGIKLEDAEGRDVLPGSTSQIAAKQGVYSTTASRAILQAPVYFLPPVLLGAVPPIRRYLAQKPGMTVPVTTYLLLVCFGCGLPATVAIFPQISSIPAAQVEERFHHLRDPSTQKPYEVFYYNKGL